MLPESMFSRVGSSSRLHAHRKLHRHVRRTASVAAGSSPGASARIVLNFIRLKGREVLQGFYYVFYFACTYVKQASLIIIKIAGYNSMHSSIAYN